jgi:tetratricopeptide (TPR) repeat protein
MIRISLVLAAVALAAALAVSHAQERAGRFDYLVRADMFNGFEGDEEAFDRAMALCEQRLAANPDDPEPLVWHGVGLMFRAGRAAMAGGREQAAVFGRRGFDEMARAVALAPDTVGVLIPRGAVLLAAAKQMPDGARSRDYVRIAMGDFEKALSLQRANLARMSTHAKGELLGGLADAWSRLDDVERARVYLRQVVDELPDSKYAAAAQARLANATDRSPITCLGCHQGRAQ